MYSPRPYQRLRSTFCTTWQNFTDTTKPLDPRVVFARASAANRNNSAGALAAVSSGVARAHASQDYNPATLAARGFWIEGQRTNIIRNSTMAGASAPSTAPSSGWYIVTSTVGGVTAVIVGTGTENGMTYLDLDITLTAGSTAGTVIFYPDTPAATSSTTYTTTMWLKIVSVSSGSVPQMRFNWQDGVTTTSLAYFTVSSSALTEYTNTITTGPSGSLARTNLQINTSAAGCTFRLRVAAPQTEAGNFRSSTILTSGSSAARLSDDATMPIPAHPEGTAVVAFSVRSTGIAGNARGVVELTEGNYDNVIQIYIASGSDLRVRVKNGGATQVDASIGTVVADTLYKVALAWKANDFAWSVNGGAVGTDTSGTVPTVGRLNIGFLTQSASGTTNAPGDHLFGHIRQNELYAHRLSNAQLVAQSS